MIDYRWMSAGGILLDGSGDIQLTDASIPESLVDMIFTRLKADSNSWRLYRIGANLSYRIGDTVDPELELKIKRQITESLTFDGLLRKEDFQVQTIASGETILAIVYLNEQPVATVSIPTTEGGQVTVQ